MRTALFTLGLLAACSSTLQQRVSQDFQPVLPPEPVTSADTLPDGAIWSPASRGLFVSHRRAMQVGDVLTVELDEGFQATNSHSLTTARQSSQAMQLPGLMAPLVPVGTLDSSSNSNFAGTGAAVQSNALSGRMSVTVVRVLPGGNLEIMGEKRLTMNSGDEYIRLRGVVRPADISANNVVRSDRIAQAVIQYVGAGDSSDASRTGWLRRLLTTVDPL